METTEMVPKLRFTGFIEYWTQNKLNELNNKQIKWSITGGPFGSDLKSEDYTESGVRIIQLQNIGDGFFNDSNKIFTTEIKANQLIACNIYPGEIILSKMGDPVARACIIPFGQERYLMSSDGIRFVNDPFTTDRTFLYFYINSSYFRRQAISVSTGSTRRRIGLTDLKEIRVNLPSLQEQQKIASFLSSTDGKISQLEKKKTLLETYKRGIMQKIFSQELRFKDENGKEFPEWEEKKFGQLFSIGSGRDYKHLEEGEIPVYGSGGIMTYVNEYLYDGESVGIGRKGTIDKPIFLEGMFWTVDTLFYTHSFVGSIPKYIFYLFQNLNWYRYNEASGVPSLSKSTIEKIFQQIPTIKEQKKIASFLASIDKKIETTSTQLKKTREFKKGLLQQMFV